MLLLSHQIIVMLLEFKCFDYNLELLLTYIHEYLLENWKNSKLSFMKKIDDRS